MRILALTLLACGSSLALAAPTASAPRTDSLVLQSAAQTELSRSLAMQLPDQQAPYFVSYEVLDGQVATAEASFGALTSTDDGPYRTLRVDVRVGDYAMDNGNFEGNFGDSSGTRSRLLPDEDVEVALRRELWLATDQAYKGATEQLSSKLSAREGVNREFGPDLYRIDPLVTGTVPRPAAEVAPLEQMVRALSRRLVGQGLEEGSAVARDWQGVRTIVSSEGTQASMPTGFSVVRVEAVLRADDGARLRNTRSWVAPTPAGLPSLETMSAEVDEMVGWLHQLRDAPVEEDYLGPVVFLDLAAVEVFRQLIAPEMSGTPAPERPPDGFSDGELVPIARVGRRLLPFGWTVADNPLAADAAGLPGGYLHDFEGVPAQPVAVVEDGVVRTLLMSRAPRKGFDSSTGHGRSLGSGRRVAVPAAVTVTAKRGRKDKRLLRKGLALARQTVQPYVLVVRRLEPPALTEDFRVAFAGEAPLPGLTRPTEAWRLYPDGTVQPVRGLEFVGVDRRVLRDVILAGRTAPAVGVMDAAPGPQRFSIGAVGGLPASWSVPSVLIGELELHGGGGREQRVLPAPPEDGAAPVAAAD